MKITQIFTNIVSYFLYLDFNLLQPISFWIHIDAFEYQVHPLLLILGPEPFDQIW